MFLSILKVIFLSFPFALSGVKGSISPIDPLTLDKNSFSNVSRKEAYIEDDYIAITASDITNGLFNDFVYDSSYTGSSSVSNYQIKLHRQGNRNPITMDVVHINVSSSNSHMVVYQCLKDEVDYFVVFSTLEAPYYYEDGFEDSSTQLDRLDIYNVNSSSPTFYQNFFGGLDSYIRSQYTYFISSYQLNYYQFEDLYIYLVDEDFSNTELLFTYGDSTGLGYSIENGYILIQFSTFEIYFHGADSTYPYTFSYDDMDRDVDDFNNDLKLWASTGVIFNEIKRHINSGTYINGVDIVLPLDQQLNLHGLLNATTPFFRNVDSLHTNGDDGTPYYMIQGEFLDVRGKKITGIYYDIQSAINMAYFDYTSNTYKLIQESGEGVWSEDTPEFVFINSLWYEYDDYAENLEDRYDRKVIQSVSSTQVQIDGNWYNLIPTKWEWIPYFKGINQLKILSVDGDTDQVRVNVPWNAENYMGLFKALYANPISVNDLIINIPTGNSFTPVDVFPLINEGLVGLTGFFTIEILPSITLGMLVLVPFTITIILFVVSLFKR